MTAITTSAVVTVAVVRTATTSRGTSMTDSSAGSTSGGAPRTYRYELVPTPGRGIPSHFRAMCSSHPTLPQVQDDQGIPQPENAPRQHPGD